MPNISNLIAALRKGHAERKMDAMGMPPPPMVMPWSASAVLPDNPNYIEEPSIDRPQQAEMRPTPRNELLGGVADMLRKAPAITGESGDWIDARAYGDPVTRGSGQATKLDNPQGLVDLAMMLPNLRAGKLAGMLRNTIKAK